MTEYTLTHEDVRKLRIADSICFDSDSRYPEGEDRIRAITRATDRATEQIYFVGCESVLTNYGGDQMPNGWHAFDMIHSAQHTPEWRTIASFITAGCSLTLHWHRNNASPVTDEAGLVVDYLNLRVNKPNGKVLTFRIRDFVGLDNSARMIRSR